LIRDKYYGGAGNGFPAESIETSKVPRISGLTGKRDFSPISENLLTKPLHSGGVMLVFWYKQGDEDVHVEKTNHSRTLFGTAVREATHVLSREGGSAVTARKHRDASLEAHVRIRYPSKKRLDEFVHALTGLVRQSGESLLQRGVDSDRGVRHIPIIVPRPLTVATIGERREGVPCASTMSPKTRSIPGQWRGTRRNR
jgi:hypothetical protein